MLKINKKKDSVKSLLLDFLLKLNFFLKIYLSDLIFKFGMFKSAIHKAQRINLNYSEKKLTYSIVFVFKMLLGHYFEFISSFFSLSLEL